MIVVRLLHSLVEWLSIRGQRRPGIRRILWAPGYIFEAARLVHRTNPRLSLTMGLLAATFGILPGAMAYVGRLLIDSMVLAGGASDPGARSRVLGWVAVEFGLGVLLVAVERGLTVSDGLLRLELAQSVSELALRKSLTLDLADVESPNLADSLRRVREHAAERPLSLVRRALAAIKELVELFAFAALLATFSRWLPAALLIAAIPTFIVELRFNAGAYQLFCSQSPEFRRQGYYEELLTRLEYAKEVKLFGLGPLLLERHRQIFQRLYGSERQLALRRGFSGLFLALASAVALGAGYVWVTWAAVGHQISIGRATMLFVALRQVQASATGLLLLIAGMHEDHLYLSTLNDFLGYPLTRVRGAARVGSRPGDGMRLENVTFTYAEAQRPSIRELTVHLPPGIRLAVVGRNGSGKSTLLKLMAGLYKPSSGRILLDGTDVEDWDAAVLRNRVSAIFQDFVRYQLSAGENVGAGAPAAFDDERAWRRASRQADADGLIEALPDGYQTLLGKTFEGGVELSIGEWQRLALARLLAQPTADVLLLDEPSSSLDPTTEAGVLERLNQVAPRTTVVLISHRLSTVRRAQQIVVLERGKLVESGTHDQLLASPSSTYSRLFSDDPHRSGDAAPKAEVPGASGDPSGASRRT